MKKLLGIGLACITMASMAMVASAQNTGSKDNGTQQGKLSQTQKKQRIGLPKIYQELNLTDTQKTQIKEIIQKTQKDVKAVQDGTGTKQAKQKDIRDLRLKSREEIMKVLTDEQKTKYETLTKQVKPNKNPSVLSFAKQLNLTKYQKSQIKDFMAKARKDIKAIQDGSDTADVKKTKIKAIREESQKATMNILTDEQKKKLKELQDKKHK
jgi:Spy/CpxP family protein refolding chaperone